MEIGNINADSIERGKKDAERKLKIYRRSVLESLAQLPGFEECANLDFDKDEDREKISSYVSKYKKEAGKLETDPRFKAVIERITSLNKEGRWYKAEVEGVCIGWDPDYD